MVHRQVQADRGMVASQTAGARAGMRRGGTWRTGSELLPCLTGTYSHASLHPADTWGLSASAVAQAPATGGTSEQLLVRSHPYQLACLAGKGPAQAAQWLL